MLVERAVNIGNRPSSADFVQKRPDVVNSSVNGDKRRKVSPKMFFTNNILPTYTSIMYVSINIHYTLEKESLTCEKR